MEYSNKILILGPQNEILAEYPTSQQEKAYQHCLELEQMGIEITMRIPSLPEGLASALGGTSKDCGKIRDEIEQEISHHID